MKIGIQTWGSEGDIRPFLALANGLAGVGHQVTLVITSVEEKDYTPYAGRLGIEVRMVGRMGFTPERLEGLNREMLDHPNPMQQVVGILRAAYDPFAGEMFAAAQRLCAENELIVTHFMHHVVAAAAELSGRPLVAVALLRGAVPSREYAPLGMPELAPWLNRIWWWLGDRVMGRVIGPQINAFRAGHGLAPQRGIFAPLFEQARLTLIAQSPVLGDRPADWDPRIELCGFMELPGGSVGWEEPARLAAFLEGGPPPLFMGFGSMTTVQARPEETLELFAAAARLAGCRAILQGPWGDAPDLGPDLLPIGFAPHDRLLPRCAAMVHHAGAGTTHAACRAGIPSIVVAHIADQLYWGDRMRRLGIALPSLHRRNLTVEGLTAKIRATLADAGMQGRAREVGRRMQGESGVARAVGLIEALGP